MKDLLKEKQNVIYEKDKIIRKFLMEKTEFVEERTHEGELKAELLKANLAIDSFNIKIQKHIEKEHNLNEAIGYLEKKLEITSPLAGKDR